jgi:hypothetical protein
MAQVLLSRQKCFHHPAREAAARCTSCSRYFCRECVVELDGRLVCAACLKSFSKAETAKRVRFKALRPWLAAAAGFTLAWLIFYTIGLALLTMPALNEGGAWGAR